MKDNIMFYPAIVLMIVEAGALAFLIWSWRDAKKKQKKSAPESIPFAKELMPMGAVTYAIACSHCKNRGPKGNDKAAADRCHRCRCEIESGFEVDPATYMEWIPVTERLPDLIPCNAGTAYSEAVIVWTDGRKAMIAVWDGTDFICPRYYWDVWEEKITHWMPLPEPPMEVE